MHDYNRERCPNMNHGRANSAVRFCPTCGEALTTSMSQRCNNTVHLARRKEGDKYCSDCGLQLSTL